MTKQSATVKEVLEMTRKKIYTNNIAYKEVRKNATLDGFVVEDKAEAKGSKEKQEPT